MSVRAELAKITGRLLTDEPPEIRDLRTGRLPGSPGSYGQYFTTWDFANGILRDYSMNLYQLTRLAARTELDADTILTVFADLDPVYSSYLGYSGFTALREYAEQISLPVDDKSELVERLSALTAYANRLTSWSHHYFPWNVGEHYRYETTGEAGTDARDDVAEPPAIPVRLSWDPLGVEVTANIYRTTNPELCEELLGALPFTVLQDHAVVSGKSMYAWTPLVSLAATPVTERICDAPPGRLRFSQATGNKLIVQYGHTTETLSAPVLGRVAASDLGRLDEVGRAVWESTFRFKERIWLTVETA